MNQLVSFQYLVPLPAYSHERPYQIFDDVNDSVRRGNLLIANGPEQHVEDVRSSAEIFDLDVQGFVFETRPLPAGIDWHIQDDIENTYIPSVKAILRDVLGEDILRCESFDWREVLDRMRQIFGDEADDLAARHRVRLINVWRPLVDVVEDLPLTLCDARSASLIEVSFVDKGFIRHNFMAKHSADFRFCYLGGMGRDEVCIFKVFDSQDGVAKRVLHSSFRSNSPYLTQNHGKALKLDY